MLSNFRRYSHQSVWMNNWEVNLVRPYAVRRPRVCIFYFFLSFFQLLLSANVYLQN